MGGDTRTREDIPKGPPKHFLSEVGAALGETGDACARPQVVDFYLQGDAVPQPGARIRITGTDPLTVQSGSARIGMVAAAGAAALAACIQAGWKLTGRIETVDAAAGTGRAVVTGHRD